MKIASYIASQRPWTPLVENHALILCTRFTQALKDDNHLLKQIYMPTKIGYYYIFKIPIKSVGTNVQSEWIIVTWAVYKDFKFIFYSILTVI